MKQLAQFFDLREMVCPDMYGRFHDFAWNVFDSSLLYTLLVLRRDILQVPMTINNWHTGGSFSQRGYRCNLCELVASKTRKKALYATSHGTGKGLDFDAKGMTAEHARELIERHADLLPYPIRLERGTNWVHFDLYNETDRKVSYFNG